LPAKASAESLDGPPLVTAKAWAVADGTTGKVLWGGNQADPRPIASTTKIMTALLVLELAEKDSNVLDEEITFSERAAKTTGSSSKLKAGERLPVKELLYGMLLPSGNDAGVALAEQFGPRFPAGTDPDPVTQFVAAMNRKAKSLGLKETSFADPIGLSKDDLASAGDLAALTWHAWQSEAFRTYTDTRRNAARAGVKFVNKTVRHLAAGPLAVYDGDTFAGDARIPALKPNDTRLISYAVDLYMTANYTSAGITSRTDAVKLGPVGILLESTYRTATTYTFRNAATVPRTVLVEHPVAGEWKMIGPVQPAERTRSFARFEVAVQEAGIARLTVSEERKDAVAFALNTANVELDGWLASPVLTAAVRAAISRAKADRAAIAGFADTINDERSALKAIAEEQGRIRANIERVQRDSDAYKRYLKKFDDQETEIERRQSKVTEVQAALDAHMKAFAEFVKGPKAE
jgi:hypothetical protein